MSRCAAAVGPEFTMVYIAAYFPLSAETHPAALGRRARGAVGGVASDRADDGRADRVQQRVAGGRRVWLAGALRGQHGADAEAVCGYVRGQLPSVVADDAALLTLRLG
jgi:hypothetical protein